MRWCRLYGPRAREWCVDVTVRHVVRGGHEVKGQAYKFLPWKANWLFLYHLWGDLLYIVFHQAQRN